MKSFIKTSVFLLIFVIMFSIASRLYNPSGTMGPWFQSNAIMNFYKKSKNSVDTIYVGDSSVYSGISPLEIYNNIGVTGYSYSTAMQTVWSSYYLLKEAYKTQSPQIIFMETGQFFTNPNNQDEKSKRYAIDPLKMSKNKIDMINDKDYNFSNYEKMTCIFPIIRYHSRWNKLSEYDIRKFVNTDYLYEGYSIQSKVVENKYRKNKENDNKNNSDKKITDQPQVDEVIPLEVENKLNDIKSLCNEHNSKLVLLDMPDEKTWSLDQHNQIKDYADKNNIDFLDLNMDENISIDWNEDSQDGGEHLNIYGAEKVGKYLSNYISNNFKLENHKNDLAYNNWNEQLNQYNEEKMAEKKK